MGYDLRSTILILIGLGTLLVSICFVAGCCCLFRAREGQSRRRPQATDASEAQTAVGQTVDAADARAAAEEAPDAQFADDEADTEDQGNVQAADPPAFAADQADPAAAFVPRRLSLAEVQLLTLGGAMADGVCGICLHPLPKGHPVRELPCEHEHHAHCIDSWLQHGNAMCPLCREEVLPPAPAEDIGEEIVELWDELIAAANE